MAYTPKRALPTSAVQVNHAHRRPGNSVSSRKKEAARNKKLGISAPSAFNIKANTQNNYMAKWKYVKKLMDREHRKHHPLINRRITSDLIEPPIFVALIGPPGVGKSLLIKSLIKHYTTTKITDCRGPITILANSNRRITFFECPNDLNSMIDIAKTCDLALLLVDASYGFEMETFEFLNCAQIHGFPRIMGVLTHLDKYVKLKKKQSIVYHVKHRFWKEIYSGAKLFVLKGIDTKSNQNIYYKSDIINLVRFISVLKFRPLKWRNSHSYILCDRYEDLTEPALIHKHGAKHIARKIAFYGYVRGCNLRSKQNVHICGIGDYSIESIEEMEDPVPTKKTSFKSSTLRILNNKNNRIYAPMANIGPVIFDKHAAYIHIRNNVDAIKLNDKKKHSWETDEAYIKRLKNETNNKLIDIKTVGSGAALIKKLRDNYNDCGINDKMKKSKLRLFNNSKALTSNDIDNYLINKKLKKNNQNNQNSNNKPIINRKRRKVQFDDKLNKNDNDDDDNDIDIDNDNDNYNDFDFNADLNIDNNVASWIDDDDNNNNNSANDDDSNNDDDDIDIKDNNNDIKQNDNLITQSNVVANDIDMKDNDNKHNDNLDPNSNKNGINLWDKSWLDDPKEIARKHKQMQKKKLKLQRQKKLKRGSSKSMNESNIRWKQNLLQNAQQIWKRTITLSEYIYGQNQNTNNNNNNNAINDPDDSDSDDEFFKIKQIRTMQHNEIDDIDSSVLSINKFDINDNNDNNNDDDDNKDNSNDILRNRFVTGDWIEAQKFSSEVEKRAHNINPDLYDEEIQKDRAILEELGAKTEDNDDNKVNDDQLDWEFKLEKLMKDKGINGDITMDDKLLFAQNGIFTKSDINDNNDNNNNDNDDNKANNNDNLDISTMELEDLARLEAKLRKKQEFNRDFDAGLLNDDDNVYDQTGITQEEQDKIFQKKGDYNNNIKKDRKGKYRGQGGLKMNDRKNLPGSGKGVYYMDIIREEMAQQNELNLHEFMNETDDMKQKLRGYIPGCYVRIIINNIPPEFDINFDLEYPLIIGSLLPQEMQFGLIQCRIKKHRWYKRLLKFNDPLIVSAGWRRYQTCPIYCMEDRNSSVSNKRLRLIKYTPDNMHCLAVFYGPILPPNTGILGYNISSTNVSSFRISATGNILSSNLSYKIVKKLKLIGEPMEIHKNTVFVRGMFNTRMEVSKFIGAKIRTVSGIRGSIKKAEGEVGNFRASFEDRLLKSDIIFLKSWVPIKPIQFYYNLRNLLLENKSKWNGMKTCGQIKYEQNKKLYFKKDSIYNKSDDIKRNPLKKFNKLVVPKKLENKLPFRLRSKYDKDIRNKKDKHLQSQLYLTKNEKIAQKFISSLSLIAVNHNERHKDMQRRKRKRKDVFKKDLKKNERLKKRQRIKKKLSKNNDDNGSQFEAVRGNKFHKEWRLQKK